MRERTLGPLTRRRWTMVKAIPEGYHALTPNLNVKGADKAIEFYKKVFGAEERLAMKTPDGQVVHCELRIGDSVLMVAEAMRQPVTSTSVMLYTTDVDATFDRAVKAGATVEMPVADMFWGDRFGTLRDPFGQQWSIATHKEDVPPDEMRKRGEAFMKQMMQQQK
jgi:PhnB protein